MPISILEEHEQNGSTPTHEIFSANSEDSEWNKVEMHRKADIARHIRRMAISSHQPTPGQERMLLLVEDAYRLWDEIPEFELPEAVKEAIVRAGSFMPTAGLVVQCWRALKERHPDLGSGTRKTATQTRDYLAWLHKAEAEKAPSEFVTQFCRSIIARLEGKEARAEAAEF